MTEDANQVEPGDWFVHAHFGAGLVKGREVKSVGEQEQNYYELETAVCTLWLPEEQLFGQKIRPLAGEDAPWLLTGSHVDSQPNGGRYRDAHIAG